MRNILRRMAGRPQTVFVRCAACQEVVARYELSSYYHHGKGFESWIRSYRGTARESGRDVQREFDRAREQVLSEYEEVLEELATDGKDV